jgi:hypothetical protein
MIYFSACGDNSVTPITPDPPTPQDSVVILSTPTDDTTFTIVDSTSISFSWKTNSYAQFYEYQISPDTNWNPPFMIIATTSDTSVTHSFYSGAGMNRYWRVRIYRQNSPYAPWSEVRHFTIQ